MWLNQDIKKLLLPIFAIIMSSIICFIIIGDALGMACLFSNPTLAKTIWGLVLFFPASVILLVGFFWLITAHLYLKNGRETEYIRARILVKNGIIAIFITGTFILLIDVIFLKVPFGIHLLFSYSFLLLWLFLLILYSRTGLAIPEEDKKTQFITLLENILPIQLHEEWLGDLQEKHYQLIKAGIPPWKVSFITLFTGLGLILSYFWLKADKFVSRWMTRAKKVF
ncbi:hypothetical protein [Microcoleus sp. S13C4]|uniref:hypothetical protein n=1 Tax=Microcoleus sp. S13C4 TaxID=3055410 RepID=UPI002FCE9352